MSSRQADRYAGFLACFTGKPLRCCRWYHDTSSLQQLERLEAGLCLLCHACPNVMQSRIRDELNGVLPSSPFHRDIRHDDKRCRAAEDKVLRAAFRQFIDFWQDVMCMLRIEKLLKPAPAGAMPSPWNQLQTIPDHTALNNNICSSLTIATNHAEVPKTMLAWLSSIPACRSSCTLWRGRRRSALLLRDPHIACAKRTIVETCADVIFKQTNLQHAHQDANASNNGEPHPSRLPLSLQPAPAESGSRPCQQQATRSQPHT